MVKRRFVSAFLLISMLFGCTVRHVSTAGRSPHTLAMAAVGDTNGYNAVQAYGQLKSTGELPSGRDVFIFNAEGVFSKSLGFRDCRGFRRQSLFLGSPEVLDSLPGGKITIASLANNHALDCGREGLRETIWQLGMHGIMTVGAGDNLQEACEPLILDVKGLRLAVLAYMEMAPVVAAYIGMPPDWLAADDNRRGVASWELCDGRKQIAEIKREADIIVVLVHMHHTASSWTETPSAASVLFVRKILDAGADIVIGSGPHVPQGIIKSERGVALLSLGNFLFHPDYQIPEKGRRSILADFTVSDDSLKLAIVPLRLDVTGIPRTASEEDAAAILKRISILSAQLGTTLQIRGERGYVEMRR
ncbi:MAG: CapA family protein [Candidatus Sulfobium sp.]|jgi:hypothetical protein